MDSPIMIYLKKYPQLTLGVENNMKLTEKYIDIVRRGLSPLELTFPLKESGMEEIIKIETPAGYAEVLYLPDREIFEYFVRVLAYECEPKEIPISMGAIMISGITNWRKIENYKLKYILSGGKDWKMEFKTFISNKENYKDTVLIVSKGCYSALSCDMAGFSEENWLNISKEIRIFHELTHFVCRKLFPQNKNEIRDEIVADCIGIVRALGKYDAVLAKKILGVEGDNYREGGRLQNYVNNEDLQDVIDYANQVIYELEKYFFEYDKRDVFECLLEIETMYYKKRVVCSVK